MKTQTSKTRIWLSTLLVLPILAILFYSFAEREYVEKDQYPLNSIQQELDKANKLNVVYIDGATKEQVAEYNTWAKKIHAESKLLSEDATWYPPIDEKELIKFSNIYRRMSSKQKNNAVEFPFPNLDVKPSEQQKATKEQVAEYNAWAKKMNSAIKKAEESNGKNDYPIIKKKEYDKYYNIYRNLISKAQRANAEAWPNIPPPPPPPPSVPEPLKTKKKEENTNGLFQTNKIQPIEIYIDSDNNIQFNGKKVEADDINKEVKKLNQHLSAEDHRKYVSASIITEKTEALDYAKSIQIKLREVNVWSSSISSNEGLKKAGLASKHFSLYSGLTVKEAEEKQKKIFNESQNVDKKIDSINNSGGPWKVSTVVTSYEFIDNNGNSSGKVNLEPTVLNKKNEPPVIYVNEKEPIKGHIALTKEELKKLKLTLSEGNVTNFKLKTPGIKTDVIQGNTISATSIKNLDNFDDGMITIFDIKDEKENRLPPIIIQLKK